MNAAEYLSLDPRLMLASAEVYYGYARAQREDVGAGLTLPAEIDYLTIAASYMAVVEPRRAAKHFALAAEIALRFAQKQMRESLITASEWWARASILSICGNSSKGVNSPRFDDNQQVRRQTPNQMVAELMLDSKSVFDEPDRERKSNNLKKTLEAAGGFEGRAVGKMRMPMSLYTRIARLVLEEGKEPDSLVYWLKDYGARINEEVLLAQSVKERWRNLYTTLLPIEPEILCAMLTFIRLYGARKKEALRLEDYSPAVRAYLEVAQAIAAAD